MCETYNGWKNRETWALQLWLENDQGLYEMVRERVQECANLANDDDQHNATPHDVGETVKALWDELTDPDEGLLPYADILKMVRDVGSEYRVDWDEIGAAWLEDLS